MGKPEEIFKIEGKVLAKPDHKKAWLFEFFGEKMWIPRSQLIDEEDLPEPGGECEVKMTAWIAKEKGLR